MGPRALADNTDFDRALRPSSAARPLFLRECVLGGAGFRHYSAVCALKNAGEARDADRL